MFEASLKSQSDADTNTLNIYALYRLRGIIIEWKGSFFSKKEQQHITIKNPFNILSHLEIFSTKDRHISRQLGTFTFNERVIENLDSLHSRPLHLDTVLSFKFPLAQALYIHIDRLLYYSNSYHRKTSKLLLEDLQLLGKRYRYPSNRRDELNKIQQLPPVPAASPQHITAPP